MARKLFLLLALLWPLAACSPPLSGTVRDGNSGAPVAGAELTLRWSGWGRAADGQLVWDAPKTETTRSGAGGGFRFSHGGGTAIDVSLPDGTSQRVEALHENMTIHVGGPWPGLRADKALLVPYPGTVPTAALRKEIGIEPALGDLGVTAGGTAFDDALGELELTGQPGTRLAFVPGSGAIPAPPAPEAWQARLALDLRRDIGWVFLGEPGAPRAVLAIAPLSGATTTSGETAGIMLYAPLPSAPEPPPQRAVAGK